MKIDLTVRKISLFFVSDGFIVYESKGEFVFRVDLHEPTLATRANSFSWTLPVVASSPSGEAIQTQI
ncbi:hypothetical protein U1Q18_048261 [Sarracenia purpurea var. burkii]